MLNSDVIKAACQDREEGSYLQGGRRHSVALSTPFRAQKPYFE